MRMQSGVQRCGQGRRIVVSTMLGIVLLLPALAFAQMPRGRGAYGGPYQRPGAYGASGAYIGAGIGQSTMKDADTTLLGVTVDDTDSAGKIFWGYMFDPNFGLEIGFVDFGTFLGAQPREEWSASSVDFSLIGAVPIPNRYSRFSLFGKVGANVWTVDDHVPALGIASTSGTNLAYGAGAQLEFTPNVGANIQWERFTNVGDPAITGRSDIDLVTLNLVYHFRWWRY